MIMRIHTEFDYLISPRKTDNIVDFLNAAAAESCEVTVHQMFERTKRGRLKRDRELVIARQMVMNELSINCGFTLAEAGRVFQYDHATVIHAQKVVKECEDGYYKAMEEPLKTFNHLINN